MKKFVISTYSFDFNVGGLKVLHKLCHLINECGREAYLSPAIGAGIGHMPTNEPFYVYDKYTTPLIHTSLLDSNEYIIVYPESWYGNYANAKNIVRWIIGPPDVKCIKTWNDSDLWFWYIDLYKTPQYNPHNYTKNFKNNLYIAEFHREIFSNKGYDRNHTCWTLRKSQQPTILQHPEGSIFIPYHENNTSEIFNRCAQFYCYDAYTFLPIQALMCGCEAIVIPNNNLLKDDFLNGSDLNKYIAYGIDDLDRARDLRQYFAGSINIIENKMIEDTKKFIGICDDYFK